MYHKSETNKKIDDLHAENSNLSSRTQWPSKISCDSDVTGYAGSDTSNMARVTLRGGTTNVLVGLFRGTAYHGFVDFFCVFCSISALDMSSTFLKTGKLAKFQT